MRPSPSRLAASDLALVAGAGLVAGLVAGCSLRSSAPHDAPPIGVAPLQYTCGRFPFGAELLDRSGGDEAAANPAAAALRKHLAQTGPDIDFLPDHGWTLAGLDADGAEFVIAGGDLGMKVVEVDSADVGPWLVTGWGDCQPRRVLPAGLGEASWTLDPTEPRPGPDTLTFTALVTERDCASGQSSEGRVVGPDILDIGHEVLVTFAVRPLGGDMQTCPGNPVTRVVVDLGEPLGDRQLLDGGTLPPGDPTLEP
jgi:hypothetical protein